MNRFVSKCKFCAWTDKARGVYDQHYRSVAHLKAQHPAECRALDAGIEELRNRAAQLAAVYGDAAPFVRIT